MPHATRKIVRIIPETQPPNHFPSPHPPSRIITGTHEPFPLSPSSFAHHGNSDTQLILIDITQPRRTSNSCNSRAPPCPRLSLGGSCWQAPIRSHFSHPATSPYPSLLRNLSPNALDLPT